MLTFGLSACQPVSLSPKMSPAHHLKVILVRRQITTTTTMTTTTTTTTTTTITTTTTTNTTTTGDLLGPYDYYDYDYNY